MDAWCSWCKAVRPMSDEQVLSARGEPISLSGICPVCGETMYTIGVPVPDDRMKHPSTGSHSVYKMVDYVPDPFEHDDTLDADFERKLAAILRDDSVHLASA